MAKRRRKKKSNLLTYMLVFLGTCLVGYLGYNLVRSSVTPTATIDSGQMGNQHAMQAVIVRNERLVDTEGLTNVRYYADEGELVYKGTRIAEVYSSGYSQTDVNKLLSERSKIKEHLKTLLASGYADSTLERHDALSLAHAAELRLLVNGRAEGNLLNLERQLTTALINRQNYLKDKFYEKDLSLAGYYNTETTLQKKIQSWTTTFLAEEDSIVSFYTDGWENAFDLGNFDEVPLELPKGVLEGAAPPQTTSQRGRSPVYRTVNPSGWYLLMINTDKDWSPTQGQTYKVQLQGVDDYLYDAVCSTVSVFGAEQLVRMRVGGDVRQVLNMRFAPATLHEQYTTGLRVPQRALYEQNGEVGVVLTDGGGRFAPVEVITSDGEYAIIESKVEGVLQTGQRIRLF